MRPSRLATVSAVAALGELALLRARLPQPASSGEEAVGLALRALRGGAIAGGAYVGVCTALALAATLAGAPRLTRLATALLPLLLRLVLDGAASGAAPGDFVLRPLPPVTAATTTTTAMPTPAPDVAVLPEPPPREPQSADAGEARSWTVRPGESFWSIATSVVGPGDERAVATYWLRLVKINRGRLRDPSNADLVFPGQVLTLAD